MTERELRLPGRNRGGRGDAMGPLTVSNAAEVDAMLLCLEVSAERTRAALLSIAERGGGLLLLEQVKFYPVGCDPLVPSRPLNVIEQINQTFTCLATLRAAAWLLVHHPEQAPLTLNLGTCSGTDILGENGDLAAEVFAAVDPRNNRKLQADIERLKKSSARHRYVFYLSPVAAGGVDEFEVEGVRVKRLTMLGFAANSQCPNGYSWN